MSLRLVGVVLLCGLAVSGCRHFSMGDKLVATQIETGSANETGSFKDVSPVVQPASVLIDTPYPTRLHQIETRHLEPRNVDVREAATTHPERYLLDTGDRLRVFVYGQPNLSREYGVDDSGAISIPLLGPLNARGLSTHDLEAMIAAKLQIEFVRDPHVNVEIVTYRPFYILGEVRNPGQYPYVNRMTAETAVAIAGGYTGRASRREIRVNRNIAGTAQRMKAPSFIRIKPGDTITIPERFF